jgi:hypothetical protein
MLILTYLKVNWILKWVGKAMQSNAMQYNALLAMDIMQSHNLDATKDSVKRLMNNDM